MRWGFFGLLIGSLATYFAIVGTQHKITFRALEKEDAGGMEKASRKKSKSRYLGEI